MKIKILVLTLFMTSCVSALEILHMVNADGPLEESCKLLKRPGDIPSCFGNLLGLSGSGNFRFQYELTPYFLIVIALLVLALLVGAILWCLSGKKGVNST